MRIRIFTFLIALLCGTWASGQTSTYARLLIKGTPKELVPQLSAIGIMPDHAHWAKGGLQAEMSSAEQQQLKQHGIAYEVMIEDLTTYYQQRNAAPQQKTSAAPLLACNYPSVIKPSHFHLGSMGGFFTLAEMEAILDSMALLYPNLITVKQAAGGVSSVEGRNIWYVKISDNPAVDEPEPELLYTALHHAREPQSLSQLIFYMWHLLENYSTDANVKALVDNRELFFVPCVNPDGYVFNHTLFPAGGGMWRKNRQPNSDGTLGIDLNRNYGQGWGYDNIGSSPTPSTDVYRGPAPFSEPETQAIRNFCNSRSFVAALNAHSFGNDLIYPWGYIPSFLTADSVTFDNWGTYLTKENRYAYGTCDQTLGYITNGSSDDWMYGEQTSKPKIFAFTPETGSQMDGFWPMASRIVDLCKFTLEQNYNLARLSGQCFVATENDDKFIAAGAGYVHYDLQRLGMSAGAVTVSILPLGPALASAGAAKVYPAMSLNQLLHDSIAFTLSPGLTAGQAVEYVLKTDDGITVKRDTIRKLYGAPMVLFSDNFNALTSFTMNGGAWYTGNNYAVSGPSCLVDSPLNYGMLQDKRISIKQPLNLNAATYVHLQYYTRFKNEKEWGTAQVIISTDNGNSFQPLCAPHETSPLSISFTEPVYDGRQENWVKEEIDLSAYAGQSIVIGFNFKSDWSPGKDGIYIDDLLIRKFPVNDVGIHDNNALENSIRVFPNPGSGIFNIRSALPANSAVAVYNALGQTVYKGVTGADPDLAIDLAGHPAGVYLLTVQAQNDTFAKKLVLEK